MARESNYLMKFLKVQERRGHLNDIIRIKANWIGHILRKNYLLHDAIEGQMTEVKAAGRRTAQLLDDLRNRRRYWELKDEAEDRIDGKDSLSTEHKYLPKVYEPANKQHT